MDPVTEPDFARAERTPLCSECGHEAYWHRLDDRLNHGPCDPAADFRCLGHAFDGCEYDCLDFAEAP